MAIKRIRFEERIKENVNQKPLFLLNKYENDKTYLGDDDAVRGYFFISFLSLYLYYKILNIIKEKKLTDYLAQIV